MGQILSQILAIIIVISGLVACAWCAIIQSQLNDLEESFNNLVDAIKKACENIKKEKEQENKE